MKLTRQAALVRDHLYANSHLTSWQAEGVYRIRRLASRVSELKNAGYEIAKETQRDATGQLYTRYAFTQRQRRRRTPVNEAVACERRFTETDLRSLYFAYCKSTRHGLGLPVDEAQDEVSELMTFIDKAQETAR